MSSGYGQGVAFYRDRASQIVRSGWARSATGALSIAYIIHHVLLLFVFPAALFIFIFGTGGTLTDPAKAYVTWDWWRIYGFAFVVFAIPFGEYWLYQERKVAFSTSTPAAMSFYNRSQINIVWGIWMVMITVLGLWSAFLTIWLGVDDFGSCSSSPICGGPSGGSTPSTGAIMLIVSMGLTALIFVVLFLGGLYVHSAARDAYASRVGAYAPVSSMIGSEMGDATPPHSAADRALANWAKDYGKCNHGTLKSNCGECTPFVGHIGAALSALADMTGDSDTQVEEVYHVPGGINQEHVQL